MEEKREKVHIDIVHTTHYGAMLYVNGIKKPDFDFSEMDWVELINDSFVNSANDCHIVTEYEETIDSLDDLPDELSELMENLC